MSAELHCDQTSLAFTLCFQCPSRSLQAAINTQTDLCESPAKMYKKLHGAAPLLACFPSAMSLCCHEIACPIQYPFLLNRFFHRPPPAQSNYAARQQPQRAATPASEGSISAMEDQRPPPALLHDVFDQNQGCIWASSTLSILLLNKDSSSPQHDLRKSPDSKCNLDLLRKNKARPTDPE